MYKVTGVFKLIKSNSYSQGTKCFCIGSDNCSNERCVLVKERLDLLEKRFGEFDMINEDQKYVDNILDEFDVETEEELVNKMVKDALTIPCYECKDNEFSPDELHWIGGEPYCDDHFYELPEIGEGFYD